MSQIELMKMVANLQILNKIYYYIYIQNYQLDSIPYKIYQNFNK